MAPDGAPDALLNRRFCLHTLAKRRCQTIPTAGDRLRRPLCHLASADRFSFTSVQTSQKEAAGPTLLAGC